MKSLKKAGFVHRSAKGSHRVFRHPNGTVVTISGNPGEDAKPYQLQQVREAIKYSKNEKK
jgi:predicted RNA binding protein YcfA (HicA-like mRNA interferase family)